MGLEDGNGTVTIKPHTDGEHMSDEVLVAAIDASGHGAGTTFRSVDTRVGVRTRSEQSMASGASAGVVHASTDSLRLFRPCGSQRGSPEATSAAPEAAAGQAGAAGFGSWSGDPTRTSFPSGSVSLASRIPHGQSSAAVPSGMMLSTSST